MAITPDKNWLLRNLIGLGVDVELARFMASCLPTSFMPQDPRVSGALGAELLTNGTFAGNLTGWTATNWSYSAGTAVHAAGNTSALSQSIQVSNGASYLIALTYSGLTAGAYAISINGTACPNFNTIETGVIGTYYAGYIATTTGTVTFSVTPTSPFNGSIGPISVKKVGATNTSLSSLQDSSGIVLLDIRGLDSLTNLGIGRDVLTKNVTGTGNTGMGRRVLFQNIGGYENSGFGFSVLENNLVGFKNTAAGWRALFNNISGFINTAFGHEALLSNTVGAYNGAFCYGALHENVSGFSNFALGVNALYKNISGNYSIGIGSNALGESLNGQNISIGVDSSRSITVGVYNVATGQYALQYLVSGNDNNAYGIQALQQALGNSNSGFGSQVLSALVLGDDNCGFGKGAGATQTAGDRNIVIGSGVNLPSTTGSDQINIGNTIYANRASGGSVSIGATSPNAKAKLEIASTTQGFLPPRMTTTQRDAIAAPPEGLMVYNLSTHKLNVFTTAWEAVTSA